MTPALSDRPLLEGVPEGMDSGDAELLQAARALLERRYAPGRHEVAAAVRLADGSMTLGLHVEATTARASLCAESTALGAAVTAAAGDDPGIVSVVSVLRRPSGTWHLIEPCGVCAELLSDLAPDARVWVAVGAGFAPVVAAELLPFKRRRVARAVDRG